MRARLRMHGDVVAAGLRERLEIGIAGRDHQMRVEDLLGVRAHRLDDVGAVGDVGNEVPVHHIDLNALSSCDLCFSHLVTQTSKVGG